MSEKLPDLQIPEFMSLSECREAIALHANNINSDISSTIVNAERITSLRSLLNLFERYNNLLVGAKSKEEITKDEAEALNHIAYEDVCNVDNPRFPENEVYMDKYRFWRGVAGERHFDPYYDPRN